MGFHEVLILQTRKKRPTNFPSFRKRRKEIVYFCSLKFTTTKKMMGKTMQKHQVRLQFYTTVDILFPSFSHIWELYGKNMGKNMRKNDCFNSFSVKPRLYTFGGAKIKTYNDINIENGKRIGGTYELWC